MLDDTAPSLTITPTSGSTTTQTKPYIVLDYSAEEATKVTLNTATLDGVDISGSLSTTDNKKFYYVPTSDLAAGEHTIVSKATDYAGNVSSIITRKFSVAARKDFKMSLLAGWNFVGVSDVTRANTEGADGATITTQTLYFGDLTDGTPGGHDIVYKYDTTNLKFVEVAAGTNVSTGEGLWIYIVPESDGSILPIVPPAP